MAGFEWIAMSAVLLCAVVVRLSTWKSLYPESKVWVRPKEWRDFFYLKLLSRADVIDPASPVMFYALQQDILVRMGRLFPGDRYLLAPARRQ